MSDFDLVPSPAHEDLSFLRGDPILDLFIRGLDVYEEIMAPSIGRPVDERIREHIRCLIALHPHASAGEIIELAWRNHPILDPVASAA